MNGYETKAELGHDWIRTERTVEALDTIRDLHDMQSFADDVNATVLDNTGEQIVMQANGWAVAPAGRNVAYVAACIDIAVSVILDRGDAACDAQNGTYTCAQPSGHRGAHERTDYRRGSDNTVRMVVKSRWPSAYGEVVQTRRWA